MVFLRQLLKFFMVLFFIGMILAVMGFCALYYAFNIEPYRLTVNTVELKNSDTVSSHFSIVQFSDTHIKDDYTADDFAKVVDEINSLYPDFVVFTGDLYDRYSSDQDNKNVIEQLNRIEADIAKIAIRGNRDIGGGADDYYKNIMMSGGFEVLVNQHTVYETASNHTVLFSGIDDSLIGYPEMSSEDVAEAFDTQDIDYAVFMSHEPDVIDNFAIDNYNLILCGHTHGGQVDIPFLPFINDYALNETEYSSKYESGLTKLLLNQNQYLYVNTGIGTTRISARFNVVPEITQFYVYM